jgi:glutamate-5-semialdehyde dehydrogenase
MTTLQDTMLQIGRQARDASRVMMRASGAQKAQALLAMADALSAQRPALQRANASDVDAARARQLEPALLDRLTLSERSIDVMIEGLRQIAAMSDPIGGLSATSVRPNGMQVAQMRVPLGVIGIIYESRPNVTIDAAALCLKSGNACILRGGSEALQSNLALAKIVEQGLVAAGLPKHAVQVIETSDRAVVGELITMTEHIDVIIPRGGKSLIKRLAAEARVPMIKHLDGNCHVYIDAQADLKQAGDIAFNAKTYRYGVCGAMETLLVHKDVAAACLPALAQRLLAHGVELRGCAQTQRLVSQASLATEEDWATEYLGPILAIRIVASIQEAIAHIERWGSGHTDSIVTQQIAAAQQFQREVDGLGAEIGISTNRLHARGPVGLEGLTTLKWVLQGDGQLRG